MITILAFVIVLGILIFIHELGHFLAAKASGVGVLRFSLGFGPAVVRKRIGETEYQVAAFPLGGYVKMLGEDPEDKDRVTHIDKRRSFAHKRLWVKAAIVFAGPLFNVLLAVVVYTAIAWTGVPYLLPVIGEVQKGSPADKAGFLPGDLIRSIAGVPVDEWEDVALVLNDTGGSHVVRVEVVREERVFVLNVRPEMQKAKNIFGEEIVRPMIGITASDKTSLKRYGVFGGVSYGVSQCYRIVKLTAVAFSKMVKGTLSVKESLGGPILIAQVSGQTFKAGFLPFVSLIAFISINLAIINLLPIPVLDGGHLLLFLIEGVTGKPVEGRPREVAQQIGLFILVMIMLFAFYNDIVRIFRG
ncbi:MAG TPA: RIP metalloprotease RseP [Deltaproteobacteria bacterium]|nr:RIP metalloprotease RseP [Deltaproteobacteria bacterium]HOM30277.1 RIP metalloprotease RseP [Deltaproteobacteria bacterium]HPP80624.1 RIP metalloprotease RseP [Deltaproteobacteria bacterium]